MVQRDKGKGAGIRLGYRPTLDPRKSARGKKTAPPRACFDGNGECDERLAETWHCQQSQRKKERGPNPGALRRKDSALLPDRKFFGFDGAEDVFSQILPVLELGKAAAKSFGLAGATRERFLVGVFELLRQFFDDFLSPARLQWQGSQPAADKLFPIMHSAPPRCG